MFSSFFKKLRHQILEPEPPSPASERLTEGEASGMTVNERLFAAGLLEAFDRAAGEGNRDELARILEQVYLTPDDIQRIVDTCFARRRSQMVNDVNVEIRQLVERWCDRRELGALASLLPAWLANNGLTDGWEILRDALKHTYAGGRELPPEERDTLKKVYVKIDTALRDRG